MTILFYVLFCVLFLVNLVLPIFERKKADSMTKDKYFLKLNELKVKASSGDEKSCRELMRFIYSHPVQLVKYQDDIKLLFKPDELMPVPNDVPISD